MQHTETMKNEQLYYPPGGLLIWIIMIVEVFTFLGAIAVFSYQKQMDPELFSTSQKLLNPLWGTINTLVLLTSGYFMALTITQVKTGNYAKARLFLFIANTLGIIFLILKGSEYTLKLQQGLSLNHDIFFMLYWLITGFHFVHVFLGVGLLGAMQHSLKVKPGASDFTDNLEASAVYWHMCDLIWILIFPVIYLL